MAASCRPKLDPKPDEPNLELVASSLGPTNKEKPKAADDDRFGPRDDLVVDQLPRPWITRVGARDQVGRIFKRFGTAVVAGVDEMTERPLTTFKSLMGDRSRW